MTAEQAGGIVALALMVGAGSWLGTARLIRSLGARNIVDRPNKRSSHTTPTPRGGGIAVDLTLIPAWLLIAAVAGRSASLGVVLAAAVVLALLSWRDDRVSLSPLTRLAVQAASVAAALAALPGAWNLFGPWLPWWLGAAIVALGWLWFVNLFNFMDGIDGIAGVEAASIGVGAAIVAAVAGLDWTLPALGLTAAAAAIGFLRWNWHPARIFLGDVGSVPLGFLLGYLLLQLAMDGQWVAAIILPLYYLADSTLTLARRAFKGERLWQAHKSHFYQRAVAQGLSHAEVATGVLGANIALVALAALATLGWPVLSSIAAAAAVAALLFMLS